MKKVVILLLAVAFVTVSCEKEEPLQKSISHPQQPAARQTSEPDWETHDPVKIQQVLAELDANRSAKGEAAARTIRYRGFAIVLTNATPADILTIVKGEIDQVYNSDVKTLTETRMVTVREINIVPPSGSGGGLFYSGGRVVMNDYASYRRIKQNPGNVLFHECVHYYHDAFFTGAQNQTNRTNLNAARARQIYAAGQYVLSNEYEYLAVNTEAFFTGTNREPFTRGRLQQKDPNEASFVRATF